MPPAHAFPPARLNAQLNTSSKDSLSQSLASVPSSSLAPPNSYGRSSGSNSNSNSNSGSIRTAPSRRSSLRHVIFPPGDARNTNGEAIHEIRNDMMVKWLHEQQLRK